MATNNSCDFGTGSSSGQVLQSGGSGASPVFSTATYPSTTSVNNILFSSSANVVGQVASQNRGVLTSTTGQVPVWRVVSDGQLIIGSSAGNPAAANLTAGSGISITNGSNTITINTIGGGMSWTVVTGTTQAGAVNNGYIANNAGQVTVTLPSTSAVGDMMAVTGMNNSTGWKIAQNAGNQIFFGTAATTAGTGGSMTSSNIYDIIFLVCITSNGNWIGHSAVGNITIV